MQVFAQKSVLVVSIYFPLITLIYTDIPCICGNLCSSVGGYIPTYCTDLHRYAAF